jgi:dienelactone hydrolase
MKLHKLRVKRTAAIYSMGAEDAESFWLITHGYAMCADQALKKFRSLDNGNNYMVAPEALSRFYIDFKGQRTAVASWMTSRERLDEIDDYAHYLSEVLRTYRRGKKTILFGFSQGGTTMWRFINQIKPDFDVFINWAGDIPEDTNYDMPYLQGKRLIYVFGKNDQYVDNNRIKAFEDFAGELKMDIRFMSYDGDHRIYEDVLNSITRII